MTYKNLLVDRLKPKTTLPLLTLLFLFLLSCGDDKKESDETKEQIQTTKSESTVKIIRLTDLKLLIIKNGTVKSYAAITGRVVPSNTTNLVAEVQGRIQNGAKPFKSGTSFRKGQTILSIDNGEFALSLEAQKSAFLNILTSMMSDLKSDYPNNYQNWLNYVSTYRSGKSLPELPATSSDSEKYFVTSRQVYTTYYNIKAQENRLSKYYLVAPFNGSLSATIVDNGGLVSPGQPLGTFISDGDYEIEAGVKLQLASLLKVGQKINFKSKDLDKTFTATISRINNIVDAQTQNIPVYLKISNPNLRSGMYLEGQIVLDNYEEATNVPSKIVNRDKTVHILKDGIIKKQTIEILSSNVDSLTVKGIPDGSQLILNTFDTPISGLKIIK